MGIYACAQEVLAGSDHHGNVIARCIDRIFARVGCSSFYLHTLLNWQGPVAQLVRAEDS